MTEHTARLIADTQLPDPTGMPAYDYPPDAFCAACGHFKQWHRGDMCSIDCPCPREWVQ